jgi:LmbE family N-acetylglucosaminyl deacetylase
MALRDAGWRIVNLACGLGRRGQRRRREAELREACELAGFELRLPGSSRDSVSDEEEEPARRASLSGLVSREIKALSPSVVLSPGVGDRHPSHRVVAEAVCEAIAASRSPRPRWWMWELWGSLPQPTIGTLFDQARLDEVLTALAAHSGELERNDYRRFVRARAEMNVSLAAELLFGFGSTAPPEARYAELLTEVVRTEGRWLLGTARWLDAADPLPDPGPAEAVLS